MRLRSAIVVGFVAYVCSSCASSWPPVVRNETDAQRLPETQRALRCINCDDAALNAIGRRFENLDYLFINESSNITDKGITGLAPLAKLRQLEVGNGSQLSDESIRNLRRLPGLRELSLDDATQISERAFIELTKGTRLTRLFILRAEVSAEAQRIMRSEAPGCEMRFE